MILDNNMNEGVETNIVNQNAVAEATIDVPVEPGVGNAAANPPISAAQMVADAAASSTTPLTNTEEYLVSMLKDNIKQVLDEKVKEIQYYYREKTVETTISNLKLVKCADVSKFASNITNSGSLREKCTRIFAFVNSISKFVMDEKDKYALYKHTENCLQHPQEVSHVTKLEWKNILGDLIKTCDELDKHVLYYEVKGAKNVNGDLIFDVDQLPTVENINKDNFPPDRTEMQKNLEKETWKGYCNEARVEQDLLDHLSNFVLGKKPMLEERHASSIKQLCTHLYSSAGQAQDSKAFEFSMCKTDKEELLELSFYSPNHVKFGTTLRPTNNKRGYKAMSDLLKKLGFSNFAQWERKGLYSIYFDGRNMDIGAQETTLTEPQNTADQVIQAGPQAQIDDGGGGSSRSRLIVPSPSLLFSNNINNDTGRGAAEHYTESLSNGTTQTIVNQSSNQGVTSSQQCAQTQRFAYSRHNEYATSRRSSGYGGGGGGGGSSSSSSSDIQETAEQAQIGGGGGGGTRPDSVRTPLSPQPQASQWPNDQHYGSRAEVINILKARKRALEVESEALEARIIALQEEEGEEKKKRRLENSMRGPDNEHRGIEGSLNNLSLNDQDHSEDEGTGGISLKAMKEQRDNLNRQKLMIEENISQLSSAFSDSVQITTETGGVSGGTSGALGGSDTSQTMTSEPSPLDVWGETIKKLRLMGFTAEKYSGLDDDTLLRYCKKYVKTPENMNRNMKELHKVIVKNHPRNN